MTLPQKDGEVWIHHGPGARRINEDDFDPAVHKLYEEPQDDEVEWLDVGDDEE